MFTVDKITDIQWQTDAFDNLVLPKEQKDLIKALVETHHGSDNSQDRFDDFIVGKGRGLVINLFGPPGVGKTLSAEATSECTLLRAIGFRAHSTLSRRSPTTIRCWSG